MSSCILLICSLCLELPCSARLPERDNYLGRVGLCHILYEGSLVPQLDSLPYAPWASPALHGYTSAPAPQGPLVFLAASHGVNETNTGYLTQHSFGPRNLPYSERINKWGPITDLTMDPITRNLGPFLIVEWLRRDSVKVHMGNSIFWPRHGACIYDSDLCDMWHSFFPIGLGSGKHEVEGSENLEQCH